MFKISLYFVVLEIFGLIAFIFLSGHQGSALFRHLPLVIALAAIGYVAFSKAFAFSYKEIIFISIMASVGFVSADQFLGFMVYPGLAKGLDFLSFENAIRTALLLAIGIVGHFLLLTLSRSLNRKINDRWYQKSM